MRNLRHNFFVVEKVASLLSKIAGIMCNYRKTFVYKLSRPFESKCDFVNFQKMKYAFALRLAVPQCLVGDCGGGYLGHASRGDISNS